MGGSNHSGDPAAQSSSHSLQLSRNAAGEPTPYAPGTHNLALDLGQVFLMGDLSDAYENSLGIQTHYTYGVSDLFGFDSSLGYSEHSNGEYSLWTLLTGVRMNLSWYDRVVPYLVGGLGFYRPSYKDGYRLLVGNHPTQDARANEPMASLLFGLHLGPGVDLQLSRSMYFGAALTLHTMFGGSRTLANGLPVSLGGTYTSFLIHLGSTFN